MNRSSRLARSTRRTLLLVPTPGHHSVPYLSCSRYCAFKMLSPVQRPVGRFLSTRGPRRRASLSGDAVRRPENIEGDLWVDTRCIDCDACRWLAPQSFHRVNDQSAVTKQPLSEAQRFAALQALVSCPTGRHVVSKCTGRCRWAAEAPPRRSIAITELSLLGSIRVDTPTHDVLDAQRSFPLAFDGRSDVFFCGFVSPQSYGAASWFIQRQDGNVMVDSPRWNPVLVKSIEQLGGIRYVFLTHKDDVAESAKYAAHFGAQRILHSSDVVPATRSVEHQLEGTGPWALLSGADDVTLYHVPGHTAGCVALLHKPSGSLFTGDHLGGGVDNVLQINREHNWKSIAEQICSVEALIGLPFTRVIPGHGRPMTFKSVEEKDAALKALVNAERAIGAS